MFRQLLNKYVVRSKQLELNKKNPDKERYCNFLCQKYRPISDFHTKQGRNMCKDCAKKLTTAKSYIKDGKITKEQFKENPSIIEDYNKTPSTEETLECIECKQTKNMCYFDNNRNTCKKCRVKQGKERIKNRIEEDIKQIENCKVNETICKQFIKTLPVNEIFAIMKHYGLTRSSTDKKDDAVFKLIQHFRQLQDPFKCLGNCGFTLPDEFSYCNGCENGKKKSSVEERNHLFKENLDIFMDGMYEITEEDMYSMNSFCIRAIAEYLGITMFKTKVKGNTKEKMVKIINEFLATKKATENPVVEQKKPELELNGMLVMCREEDGYVNATALCKAGGKHFKHWYENKQTKELITELESEVGIPTSQLIDSKKGNSSKYKQGSWIHPDLAVHLAMWISRIFSLKVSKWVRELALTGSVRLRHEKSSTELLQLQKDYNKLKTNHTNLLEKRQHHKFKSKSVYYIISDTDSKEKKYKPGLEGVDINVRLAQHRSTSPGIRLEMLVYAGMSDCKLLEKMILKRYSGKRNYNNHEWIYGVEREHIITSTVTLLDFLGIEYTKEEDIEKYNLKL